MDIKCSAGKGVMTHEECLVCALGSQHPPCGMDYSMLKSVYATMHSRPDIHVTDLVSCPRRVYYEKTRSLPEYPHLMLSRYLGTTFHESVANGNAHSLSEYGIELDGVLGTTDRYYPNQKRLVDYKTTSKIYINLLPYGSHEVQVNLYAHMLRKKGFDVESLAIQYISLTGPTQCSKCRVNMEWVDDRICCPRCGRTIKNANLGVYMIECRVYPDEEVDIVFNHRKSQLEKALRENKVPAAEPGWLCKKYCPYLSMCPEGMAHVGNPEVTDE